MSKKNETHMKARAVEFSAVDASLVYSIWRGGKLTRQDVRTAVEVSDTFDPFIDEYAAAFVKASGPERTEEERAEKTKAMEMLQEAQKTLTMSDAAFVSIRKAVKEHTGWTNMGARQLLRIEESFDAAEWVDLEPKDAPEE